MSQHGVRAGLALLKRRNFVLLFAAFLITYMGSAMAPIAMAFGVLELTGSTKTASFVIAAPVVAQIAMYLLGGAVADRTSRRRVMIAASLLAAVSQFVIAGLFLTAQADVPLLITLMLVNGVAFAFNQPAAGGMLPLIVERHELQSANALLGAARSTAVVLGAALAGVLVAAFGAGIAIALDAVSFLLAALLVFALRPGEQPRPGKASILADLRLGWNEFTAHQWLWTIVLQFAFVVAATEAVVALLGPATVREYLGGAAEWGFVAASFGVGTIVGGLLALRLNVKRPMLFATCCVFFTSTQSLALSGPSPLVVIQLAAFVAGITGQIFSVLWNTTLHREIRPELLSRVSAYDHLGSVALAPLGVVLAGYLFETVGHRTTLYITAAAVIVPTALVLLVPGVRQLRAD